MNNDNKVLCVRKEHVTAALGGQLFHGAHPLNKELFIGSIEPHLEVRPLSEVGQDTTYMQIMPYLMLPRAFVLDNDPNTPARTSLMAYSVKGLQVGGKIVEMVHTGFTTWVDESAINLYAPTQAPQGVETVPDAREGKIAFFQSMQNAVQMCVRDNVVIKDRAFEGEPEEERIVVQDVGYALVDHSNERTQCFLGVLFMCLLPKQYEAGQNYASKSTVGEIVYTDLGEVPLKDLAAEPLNGQLDSLSRILVQNLVQAEQDFNEAAAASATETAAVIEKAANDSSQAG